MRPFVSGLVVGGRDEGRHGEQDGARPLFDADELGELVLGAGQADLQPFDFAEPAFAFGLVDAGGEVVADLLDAGALGWVRPEERTSDTGLTELILSLGRWPEQPANSRWFSACDGLWWRAWITA
jgi:hypothetical protein